MIFGIGLLAAAAAQAAQPDSPKDITVTGTAQLLDTSVGQMNDHMHNRGDFMIGLRFERTSFSGGNQHGTHAVSDADLFDAGYMMRAKRMTMDMAMLDIMYAPTDDLTLTLSPQYVWNRMTMVGIDPMDEPMAFGETMKESSEGIGDTLLSASLRLVRRPRVKAHVTLGVWAPTGSVSRRNDDGTFMEYCMQPGSGTWDLEPSATVTGGRGAFGWGLQAGYRWRVEHRNDSGFRLGNRGRVSGWLSYRLRPALALIARAEFSSQGRIHGEYNGPHNDMSPPDFPHNYGGEMLTAAVGANWQFLGNSGPQLGVELGVPLYQKLNGVQVPQDWRLSTAIRHTF